MKQTYLISSLIICLALIVVIVLLVGHQVPTRRFTSNYGESSQLNSSAMHTHGHSSAGFGNAPLEDQILMRVTNINHDQTYPLEGTNGLFKIITDPKAGQYAVVPATNKHIILLKDRGGNPIWSVDALAAWGARPITGSNEITAMKLVNGELLVTIGRHSYVYVDIHTGKTTVFGSD